jgi:hypothetical protein
MVMKADGNVMWSCELVVTNKLLFPVLSSDNIGKGTNILSLDQIKDSVIQEIFLHIDQMLIGY